MLLEIFLWSTVKGGYALMILSLLTVFHMALLEGIKKPLCRKELKVVFEMITYT